MQAAASLEPGDRAVLDKHPAWGTVEGCLVLDVVQPAGKKPMSGSEFLIGSRHWVELRAVLGGDPRIVDAITGRAQSWVSGKAVRARTAADCDCRRLPGRRMTMSYILAIDQGTTSTRCIIFDRAGQAGRTRIRWSTGRSSRRLDGLSMTQRRSGGPRKAVIDGALEASEPDCSGYRGRRCDQSARDDGGVGQADWQARAQCHSLAGHANGWNLPGAGGRVRQIPESEPGCRLPRISPGPN